MQHPNILPVSDSGQAEGVVFRVSPHIEGGTVHDNLAWFQALNAAQGMVEWDAKGKVNIHED